MPLRYAVGKLVSVLMPGKYTVPAQSALPTIDVQCDFTDTGAIAAIPGTRERVPAMRLVLAAYRQHHLPIVHVVRLYCADGTCGSVPS